METGIATSFKLAVVLYNVVATIVKIILSGKKKKRDTDDLIMNSENFL